MRILQLHSNYITYEPVKKEIDLAEETGKEERRIDEVVVLFTAVEEGDNENVSFHAIKEVKDFLRKLGVNKILIYPYAHLSSNLAKPALALKVLKAMEEKAKENKIETLRAPFGWNKKFTISIKGHPLAEQSRVIQPEESKEQEKVSEALKAEEKIKSQWFILQEDGKLVAVEQFNFRNHENLEKVAKYEISKMRASQQIPPHINLMKKLEIVDYEPGSDPGNLRWYPKGRFIKSMIEEHVTRTMVDYGAMEVETPIMYDFHHPSLSDYLDRFPARQYLLKSEDKDLFLRFAACFGQFLMLHDAQFSYRQLPLRIYELTRYSFRREKSGEIAGIRRQRAFTMPDCHALCSNLQQAKKELAVRFNLCKKIMKSLELDSEDYELAIRFTKEIYKENSDFIDWLAKKFGKPVLIEMFEDKAFYWVLKWEFNFVDNQNKASALSTDQLDVENAIRYGITYIDEQGEKQHPLILHCSPSGGVERCIYAILEKAYKEQKRGKTPILPLWLAPTQVRIIPLSDKFSKQAEKIAKEVNKQNIRADWDDRSLTMQRKIREAETEWINYIIVIGQKELDSGMLPVRDRLAGKIKKIPLQNLVKTILKETKSKPFKPLPLPMKLSKRPQFYG
ncbi:MAG: threonine--tRNA ligase [Candidatus Bathyarchaeota archaeon]|nr:threonine--tRNA ligase [Candidatus Bathyarchaeota archaeon]